MTLKKKIITKTKQTNITKRKSYTPRHMPHHQWGVRMGTHIAGIGFSRFAVIYFNSHDHAVWISV